MHSFLGFQKDLAWKNPVSSFWQRALDTSHYGVWSVLGQCWWSWWHWQCQEVGNPHQTWWCCDVVMTNMKLNIKLHTFCQHRFFRFHLFVHFVSVNVFQIFNFFSFQFAGQLCQCLNISIFCVHFFNLFSLFLPQLFLRWHCAGFTFFGTHFPFSCHLTCSRLPCSGSPLVCNGDPHATKRFRNETNAIYCSFSLQPALNWSTIGHLWLFCATVGGTPSCY